MFTIFIVLNILLLIALVVSFKRNKRVFYGLLIGAVFMLGGSLYYLTQLMPTFIETVKVNWEIELPEPNKENVIASNAGGFPMNGDIFVIAEYQDADIDNVNNAIQWKSKTDEVVIETEQFFYQLSNILEIEGKMNEELHEKIIENKPNLENDFYYYTLAKKSSSFLVLIFQPQEKKVYFMQTIF